jgi:hypothetical protein
MKQMPFRMSKNGCRGRPPVLKYIFFFLLTNLCFAQASPPQRISDAFSASHAIYNRPLKIVYLEKSDTYLSQEEADRMAARGFLSNYEIDEQTGRYKRSPGESLVEATFQGTKWKRLTYKAALKKPFSEVISIEDVTKGKLLGETCFDGNKSYWDLSPPGNSESLRWPPVMTYDGMKTDTLDIRTLVWAFFPQEARDAATTGSQLLDENTARFVQTSGRTTRTWTFLLRPYMQIIRYETVFRNDEGKELPSLIIETKNQKVFPRGVSFPTDLSYCFYFNDGTPKLRLTYRVISVEAPASLPPSTFSLTSANK